MSARVVPPLPKAPQPSVEEAASVALTAYDAMIAEAENALRFLRERRSFLASELGGTPT